MDARRHIETLFLPILLTAAPGCILGNRPMLVHTGSRNDQLTLYLDGAGNYGFGKESVPLGLADAGYQGHVQHYIWTTYLGAVMDQVYYSHNRREGQKLARRIEAFLDEHPDGQLNIVALSAGTGIAVFALEELQPGYQIENAVLLSSSLSSDYDLTRAIGHVRGYIYFFWSPKDPVLRGVVPWLGTVDRASRHTPAAGAWGAVPPLNASAKTRQLYRDHVRNRQWYPEVSQGPWRLYHAGSIDRDVIRDLVAPVLLHTPPRPANEPKNAASPPVPRTPPAPAERPPVARTRPASLAPKSGPAPSRRIPAEGSRGAP